MGSVVEKNEYLTRHKEWGSSPSEPITHLLWEFWFPPTKAVSLKCLRGLMPCKIFIFNLLRPLRVTYHSSLSRETEYICGNFLIPLL